MMSPFLPFSAKKTWAMLNLEGSIEEQEWKNASKLEIKPDHKLGQVKPLFNKIEDPQIKEFEEKEYLKKSRIIGKTQLYLLNKGNKRVKLFLRNFKECLNKAVVDTLVSGLLG